MNLNEIPIILCASGNSISEGIEKGLFNEIPKYASVGMNSFYKYGCKTTFNTFVDYQFYLDNKEEMKNLDLIIGKTDAQLMKKNVEVMNNTYLLPKSSKYNGMNSWKEGFYSAHLVGLYTLTLAIALGFKEIYLIGYDACMVNGKTHFYQDQIDLNEKDIFGGRKWRGVGQKKIKSNVVYNTGTYNSKENLNTKWFAPYIKEDVNIYNVSLESAIEVFPKITYEEFFNKINNREVDQNKLRENIENQILKYIDEYKS